MTQTLWDFLSMREAEIKEQISELRRELAGIRAARSAIDASDGQQGAKPPRTKRGMNQRDMIEAVLDDQPSGGSASAIIAWVSERFGAEIPESSVSTQLSRLKAEGRAFLNPDTRLWQSAKQAAPNENAPPDEGGADAGEGATSPNERLPIDTSDW